MAGETTVCPNCGGSLKLTSSTVGGLSATAQIWCVSAAIGNDSYCGAIWFLFTKDDF